MSPDGPAAVQAAGGVVVRSGDDGTLEVVVVHRPKYDDWSLPKGKLDPGESHAEAAWREVHEETGMRCELDRELAPTRYHDRNGRTKEVRYWLMRVVGADPFTPNREVDEVRWIAVDAAARMLSYPHDRMLLADLAREGSELP